MPTEYVTRVTAIYPVSSNVNLNYIRIGQKSADTFSILLALRIMTQLKA